MPPRSIASATVAFGLVSVPVEVYSSGESAGSVSFNMLHKDCGTRLKQQYICPKDEVVVDRENTVKGYEFEKNHYVVFAPEEIKALDQKATNSIDITEFVPLAKVERIYLEKAYYLGPGKGGDRAYRLLCQALTKTGRAALGQYAARGQQHLVLVRPMDDVLVMEQLHYADELRSAADVPRGDAEIKPLELNLAVQLIEQGSSDEFNPAAYHDTVRERVLEAIQQKVEGQEITAEPEPEQGGKVLDLMEALKASLAKAESQKEGAVAKAGKVERTPKRKAAGER